MPSGKCNVLSYTNSHVHVYDIFIMHVAGMPMGVTDLKAPISTLPDAMVRTGSTTIAKYGSCTEHSAASAIQTGQEAEHRVLLAQVLNMADMHRIDQARTMNTGSSGLKALRHKPGSRSSSFGHKGCIQSVSKWAHCAYWRRRTAKRLDVH